MFDAIMYMLAPPLLALTLVLLAAHVVTGGVGPDLALYGAGLAAAGLAYSGYGLVRDRNLRALRMTWYGLVHIALLIPSRIHALCTLTDDRWGQRGVSLHIAPSPLTAEPVTDPARMAA
jgi:hypothetical protein